MPVAVAADPCAEAHARQVRRIADQRGIEARRGPCVAQARIEFGQHGGKNVAQIVEHVAPLVGERRLLEQDLAGAPQAFERGLRLVAQRLLAGRCEAAAVALGEELEERAMLVEHGEPLRLGRVRGEHGLDTHPRERLRDLRPAHAAAEQARELVAPESALGGEPLARLAQRAHARGGAFLHHVQELEGDGIDEAELRGQLLRRGLRRGIGPRQMRGEFGVAEFREHFAEAPDEEAQIAGDLFKSDPDIIRHGAGLRFAHRNDGARLVAARSRRGKQNLATFLIARAAHLRF